MTISVEGLDGVGKTTLVNNLSTSLGIRSISKPIDSLLLHDKESSFSVMEHIYDYSTNIQAMYYLMGNLSALEDGRKEDVILDRGFLSTYYFSCHEENQALFDFFASHYGFPDLTILLYASVEERVRRIRGRDKLDQDLAKGRIYVDGYDKMFEAIKRYNIPHIAIDTEGIDDKETARRVMEILREYMSNSESRSRLLEEYSIDKLNAQEMKLERRVKDEGNN